MLCGRAYKAETKASFEKYQLVVWTLKASSDWPCSFLRPVRDHSLFIAGDVLVRMKGGSPKILGSLRGGS